MGGHKMVHCRPPAGRPSEGEHTTTLARSKSMDMVAMANRTDENKRRLVRASSVTRLEEEDWREQTPFLRGRRGGRRGARTSWGLDEQGVHAAARAGKLSNHRNIIRNATTDTTATIHCHAGSIHCGTRPSRLDGGARDALG